MTDAGREAVEEPHSAAEWAAQGGDELAADNAAPATEAASTPRMRSGTKQAMLIKMLRAENGATIVEICEATGWLPHTVRGAFACVVKK